MRFGISKVQPDLEELEGNMEDNEDAESAKEEVKLGKLQFSMDYDFQKSEVSRIQRVSSRDQGIACHHAPFKLQIVPSCINQEVLCFPSIS